MTHKPGRTGLGSRAVGGGSDITSRGLRAIVERVRIWWQVETAIAELTRDRAREDHIIQVGAREIAATPYAIGLLFRPSAPQRREQRKDSESQV